MLENDTTDFFVFFPVIYTEQPVIELKRLEFEYFSCNHLLLKITINITSLVICYRENYSNHHSFRVYKPSFIV